jgi:hypothetical protein
MPGGSRVISLIAFDHALQGFVFSGAQRSGQFGPGWGSKLRDGVPSGSEVVDRRPYDLLKIVSAEGASDSFP